jgi:hypothetical protein
MGGGKATSPYAFRSIISPQRGTRTARADIPTHPDGLIGLHGRVSM